MTDIEEKKRAALREITAMEGRLKGRQPIWNDEYATYLCVHWETIRAALTHAATVNSEVVEALERAMQYMADNPAPNYARFNDVIGQCEQALSKLKGGE